MVPLRGDWTPFSDLDDQLEHYRRWGLIPEKSKKLRPVMVVDGYFGIPEPCEVVGYQGDSWAVIVLEDGLHAIHGEYLAELQPDPKQELPAGMCFAQILSNYVVLDIETTGLDYHRDRIIEIAAASYSYGQPVAEFHTLVNPGMTIPDKITRLTGITQPDVDTAPSLQEAAPSLFAFVADRPIVGHNIAGFDIPFLSAQLKCFIGNPVIDTLYMSRAVFELLPRHSLEYLNTALKLGSAGGHRANHDVKTTNALLWACLAPRRYETLENRAYLDAVLGGEVVHTRKLAKARKKVDHKSIKPSNPGATHSGPLSGKTIVFTGELTMSRMKAMQMAVDVGAVLKGSVSRQLDYLVVGKQDLTIVGMDGISTKEAKARQLNAAGQANISIIHENDFLRLLGKEEAIV